jgi:hypothetical protein
MDLSGGNPNPYRIVPSAYNPGNIGANVTTVNQATGVVGGISVGAGPTSLEFRYVAPDTRPCSVDVSTDGTSWTRSTDSGGAFQRSLLVSALNPNTAYQYRLMCYFDQAAAYEFLPDQITTGTATTATALARTVFETFTLPTGAAAAAFSFVAADGSVVNQTCNTSPCAVGLGVGTWTRKLVFQTAGSAVVGSPSATEIKVP